MQVTEDQLLLYARGSDTSKEAAESIVKDSGRLRMMVFNDIRRAGKNGRTCDEIEARLELRHQTASARVNELMRAERIVDSGARRKTRSNRNAVVWIVASNRG